MADEKISDIVAQESTAMSDTDLMEGEESGGTSFKVAFSVIKSTIQTAFNSVFHPLTTVGIADNNLLEVDGSPNSGEYAKFTANGLDGRTESEFLTDFSTVISTTNTKTLTNKRVTPRIGSTTSSSTPTPNGDSHDQYEVTALAVGATFGSPTGTPTDGQKLIIRVKDNGTARSLAWNAIYRVIGTELPTTTVISKTIYVGCIYNSADTKWDVVAVAEEA